MIENKLQSIFLIYLIISNKFYNQIKFNKKKLDIVIIE